MKPSFFLGWGVVIYLCLFAFLSPPTLAQELVLDSLIAEALRVNPDIQSAKARFQAEKLKADASGTLPDPTLGIAFSNLPTDSYRLDQTPMSGISVGITQMVPFPAKLRTKADISHLIANVAKTSHVKLAKQLVRKVKSVFYNLSYWSRVIKIIKENIALMEGLEQVAEAKYAAGEGLAADVLRAQTSVSQLRNRLLSAEKMYQTTEEMLLSLLNRPTDGHLGTPPDLPEMLPELALDSLLTEAKQDNPQLKIVGIQRQVAEKSRSLAFWNFWPDFNFGVDYRIREFTPMDPVQGTDFFSFRLSMSLPLWFFNKQTKLLDSAKESLIAAKDAEQGTIRWLEYEITERYQEAKKNRGQFDLYKQALIPQAKSTLESSMIAYQVGKVDFLNLITSQLSVFNLEIEKLSTLNSFHQALFELEELSGSAYKGDVK